MKRLLPLPLLALALLFACAGACGGKGARPPEAAKADLDADPLALLPPAAVVVASVDARALFDAPGLGAKLAALADGLLPLGPDAGFEARRDVDRIVVGSYAQAGVDFAAIVSGRFDTGKLAAAATSRSGAPILRTMYAGVATYAVGQGVYAVLTGKTVVAGTSEGVRRVLDRVHDGKPGRALPAWVLETLQTPGAEVAVAADLASQPLPAIAIGALRLPWTEGIRQVRALGDLQKPGMNVAATLTYGTEAQASAAADGAQTLGTLLKLLGPLLGGVSVRDLEVQARGADVQCKLAVDEPTLAHLLALAPRALPEAR